MTTAHFSDGIVTLETPKGTDCAHAFLYGNLLFMNATHFIRLDADEGYVGMAMRRNRNRPQRRALLAKELQKNTLGCFRQVSKGFCVNEFSSFSDFQRVFSQFYYNNKKTNFLDYKIYNLLH